MKDNNTVQCDERALEHGFGKVKITHIPDNSHQFISILGNSHHFSEFYLLFSKLTSHIWNFLAMKSFNFDYISRNKIEIAHKLTIFGIFLIFWPIKTPSA